MMIPTLETFIRALLMPESSFATLTGAQAVTDADGRPRLLRTTHFAEAQIDWRGCRWLLSLPLSPTAVPHVERTAAALRSLKTDRLAPYSILPDELRWTDGVGRVCCCDLVLQLLPDSIGFDEAVRTQPHEVLIAALHALENDLKALNFTHNNLKADNLRWTGARFVPFRYHDAVVGAAVADGDAAGFDALRRAVNEAPDAACVGDVEVAYEAAPRPLEGHRWTSPVFEGLVCVEDESGYGFVDTDNRVVIPSHFVWAGDFHENRAEVETPDGMGLIDREGNYILPPEYEIVEYDPTRSIVRVRQQGRWALFDYMGRQLTDFQQQQTN